jgi:hypothetical protein
MKSQLYNCCSRDLFSIVKSNYYIFLTILQMTTCVRELDAHILPSVERTEELCTYIPVYVFVGHRRKKRRFRYRIRHLSISF